MAIDLSWFKATALSAVQHAAAVALTAFSGDAFDFWSVEWHKVAGLAGGTAVVSILSAIVAYGIPNQKATSAVNVTTGAVQVAHDVIAERPLVGDVHGAKGTSA